MHERKCQSLDANLVSLHNKLENEFVRSLLPPSTTSWAGAHDGEQDGQWMWTDGTAFDFKGWCSGEPNNSQRNPENCLEINHTTNRCWNDAVCKESRHYVCAKEM
ncbi:ladderlectin-like isoform X2 [Chanodichthys erythropterus]|uniref:ladderlectin-like isoform X2 n=1 Tax=Chanodichthys erythropterus TaxID=933992 RepID=UPI00351F5EF0